MLSLEIVSKRRRPIKLYAIYGILFGILLLIVVAILGHRIQSSIAKMLMGLSAFTFIICLFIMNYSYKFKNPIGHISFSPENIEIETLGKREIISLEAIIKINFKLVGYEGLNTSTFSDFLIVPLISLFSYHSGINNYVYIKTARQIRKFEIYIPDKKNWSNLKSIAQYYRDHKK
jgi:hypothetical protein